MVLLTTQGYKNTANVIDAASASSNLDEEDEAKVDATLAGTGLGIFDSVIKGGTTDDDALAHRVREACVGIVLEHGISLATAFSRSLARQCLSITTCPS